MPFEHSFRQLLPAISLVAALSLTSCSHRTPYLRETGTFGPALESARPEARLVLVGDAGETNAPVLAEVRTWAGEYPEETVVVFLGDNFYPEGMTPARADEADTKLLPQIQAATSSGARVLFVPGNHDWDDGGPGGYEAVLAQAAYVRGHVEREASFLPAGGCPGPTAIDALSGVRIIAVDTQWWLHEHDKPEACPYREADQFRAAFSDLLETERTVVVAAHHPLFGFGRHAAFSEWREHLLPPVVGTAIALWRKLRPSSQDYNSEPNQAMTALFRSAISTRSESAGLLIWAAGHEHNLQVLEGQAADYVLISGSAAKTTPVTNGPETLFAHSNPGFMVVDVMGSGEARLRVIEPEGGEVFAYRLETHN